MNEDVIQKHKDVVASLTAPDGRFALVQQQVGGRVLRSFGNAPESFAAFLKEAEGRFADRVFLHEEGVDHDYASTFDKAWRLGRALIDEYGVKPGDRIGLCMANRLEYFAALFAAARVGATAVLFNSRSTAEELGFATSDVDCTLIIADERRAALLREAGCDAPLVIAGDTPSDLTNAVLFDELIQNRAHAPQVAADADAPLWILFTSGTSGRAKGAVLTQRNICNMVRALDFVGNVGLEMAARQYGMPVEQLREFVPPPSSLLIFPMFHISGLTSTVSTLLGGGLMTTIKRWDPAVATELIAAKQVNVVSGPPLVLNDLLDQPGAEEKLATISAVATGGQATPPGLTARIGRSLPKAVQGGGWGMTESAGSVCTINSPIMELRPQSAGLMNPVTDIRVVDDEGRELPAGETGELQLRGVLIMNGYWNAPEATQAAFDGEWYRTGDVGYLDEQGFVHICDRKKDMVISAGENIYCAEVERVLDASGHFSEAILFGIPDERLGERAIAAVTLKDGVALNEDEVKAIVAQSLAAYKVPAAVAFDLGPFPRNATGKVLKAQVRERYLAKEPA